MDTLGFWIGIVSGIITIIAFVAAYWGKMNGIKRRLGGNNFILGLLICSFCLSAISIYKSSNHRPHSITVTMSAYTPPGLSPLRLVRYESFENADVPLDGFDYDNDTFKNVCFLYDGGTYELQNVTLSNGWRLCVKDDRLKNYANLLVALRLMDSGVKHSSRTVIKEQQSTQVF